MRKNWYLLAFMLGLSVTLGGAALFKRLGLPLPFSSVIQAQAAGLAPSAAAYTLDWFSVDGGGGTSSGGSFTLVSTLGQADAGTSASGSYTLQGGFLPGTLQPWMSFIPLTRH